VDHTPTRPLPTLGEQYRILRELGAGGMAVVYLADDLKHHRQVAIKVLRPGLAAVLGPDRFLAEIRTTAGLQHPHILPLYDSGEAGGSLFYVMPFIDGESVRERLDRSGALPVDEALAIVRQVADALIYAHARDVIHRDIKPENILLANGHAYVADFGIARAISAAGTARLTQTGMAIGTPAYMSPEQAYGEEGVDQRADLYSLGCLCYEMLTGKPPFEGSTPQAILVRRFTQATPRLSAQRPDIPASIDAAVHRAMAREAGDRFASVARFADALSQASAPAASAPRSVAVLPFANMSADPEDEFFADGITEEIINALAQIQGLRVAARTSCFAFKGKNEDLRTVADRLGVGTVLEGSVRKAGARLRVTAQLINAADGCHLWSERYDRELVDVFAIQDEIAGAIAAKLQIALSGGGPNRSPRAAPGNLEAYELLLKGRVLQTRRGRSILESIGCFERAVALDPGLAEAQALLGDSYRMLAVYGIAPATEMMPRARAAAERALALDPGQVEALATLANIARTFDWDVAASEAITARVLERDPSHVRALCEHALCLALPEGTREEMERALQELHKARTIDPLNAWVAAIRAFCLGFAGQLDDALAEAHHAVELDAENFTARWAMVLTLSGCGRFDEALLAAEPALMMSGRHPRILAELAGIHAARGDRAAVESVYQEILLRARTGYVGWTEQAVVAAAAGHRDEARALLARGIEARETYVMFWKLAAWAPLREDPEGLTLIRSMSWQSASYPRANASATAGPEPAVSSCLKKT
jgi:serine/threonine-protein kinase